LECSGRAFRHPSKGQPRRPVARPEFGRGSRRAVGAVSVERGECACGRARKKKKKKKKKKKTKKKKQKKKKGGIKKKKNKETKKKKKTRTRAHGPGKCHRAAVAPSPSGERCHRASLRTARAQPGQTGRERGRGVVLALRHPTRPQTQGCFAEGHAEGDPCGRGGGLLDLTARRRQGERRSLDDRHLARLRFLGQLRIPAICGSRRPSAELAAPTAALAPLTRSPCRAGPLADWGGPRGAPAQRRVCGVAPAAAVGLELGWDREAFGRIWPFTAGRWTGACAGRRRGALYVTATAVRGADPWQAARVRRCGPTSWHFHPPRSLA